MSDSDGRTPLLVLFGGQSAEHDVSCVTAKHVLDAIRRDRYDITPVGITRDGEWSVCAWSSDLEHMDPHGDPVDPFRLIRSAATAGGVVLPLLHGPFGEDGTVQGLCELAGVAYAGAGVLGSALAMDKIAAKNALAAAGIPQARWVGMNADEVTSNTPASLIERLGSPIFIKPANMGSSVGVSRASTVEEARSALEMAASYDEWIVVEEAINGREIEMSVLGNRTPRTSLPGEIVAGAEFYTYEDKYHDGVAKLLIPAPLDEHEIAAMSAMAVDAYRALRVEGLARADFFYDPEGLGWLVNELNTMPGFTPISMYPKMWHASGLEYPDLIDELIDLAIERHRRRERHTSTS
ncbi:MAG: D-alanine--D-alanine ligase family protein [Acidimicrobiales bacterium]